MSLIAKARAYATAAHSGQKRKYTGDDYIVHPIAVARLVEERGGSEAMICAALLHDTVEDTNTTEEDILANFGPEIAKLVRELTDVYTKEDYPHLNRKVRKKLEADRLALVSQEAKEIKYCDMLDNTSTIVEHDPGFAKVYLKEKETLLRKMGFRG